MRLRSVFGCMPSTVAAPPAPSTTHAVSSSVLTMCWRSTSERLFGPSAALAPAAAIVSRDGKQVAFVVTEGKASQREVTVGRSLGEDREITQGLSGGETVVLDPPASLSDGDRVRIAGAQDGDAAE